MSADDEVRTLALQLRPELAGAIAQLFADRARLQALQDEHEALASRASEFRLQRDRAQTLAGELRGHNATLQARIAELAPEEIIKARRDAHLLGAGFLRISAVGGHRYRSEHIPADQVVLHAD